MMAGINFSMIKAGITIVRILKHRDLIPAPNHFLLSAANEFKDKTEFVHQMWQTDLTYFKIIGWGWY